MDSDFLQFPNTPDGAVIALAVGERYAGLLSPCLAARGVRVLSLPKNPYVDGRLASHADLSILHLGKNRFLLSEYLRASHIAGELLAMGAELDFTPPPGRVGYPEDAALCALIIGRTAYHNPRLSTLPAEGLVSVRQGYAKCAVCPVSLSAAITSDAGLAAAMEGQGIEVLKIEAGHIALEGFDMGFIGGSAFLLSQSELAFTGRLDSHPDRARIEDFLQKRQIRPVFLTDRPVFDIGSAVLLRERV